VWVRQCLQMPQHVGAFAGVDGRRLRQIDGTALHSLLRRGGGAAAAEVVRVCLFFVCFDKNRRET
jgi:hypothetical protein